MTVLPLVLLLSVEFSLPAIRANSERFNSTQTRRLGEMEHSYLWLLLHFEMSIGEANTSMNICCQYGFKSKTQSERLPKNYFTWLITQFVDKKEGVFCLSVSDKGLITPRTVDDEHVHLADSGNKAASPLYTARHMLHQMKFREMDLKHFLVTAF